MGQMGLMGLMGLMIRVLLAALLLISAGNLAARDIYVDNVNGGDHRDGSSPEVTGRTGGPCRSVRRALQLARSSDRIILLATGEPYRESITLQAAVHSGSARAPFEVIGNGAILDGTRPVPKDEWEHASGDVFRYRPPRMSYQMLYSGGKPLQRKQATGVRPQLEPLEWCLFDRHIYFRVEAGKVAAQYDLAYAHDTVGVTIYEARHVVIRDLTVQGFQLDGVNAHDSVFDATLQGLTCRGNGRSGISIGGASRVNVIECLVGDNGAAQVRTEGFCRAEIRNCELLENTAPALVREGGQVTVTNEPPAP